MQLFRNIVEPLLYPDPVLVPNDSSLQFRILPEVVATSPINNSNNANSGLGSSFDLVFRRNSGSPSSFRHLWFQANLPNPLIPYLPNYQPSS